MKTHRTDVLHGKKVWGMSIGQKRFPASPQRRHLHLHHLFSPPVQRCSMQMMATPAPSRPLLSSLCQTCRRRLLPQAPRRTFRTTASSALRADGSNNGNDNGNNSNNSSNSSNNGHNSNNSGSNSSNKNGDNNVNSNNSTSNDPPADSLLGSLGGSISNTTNSRPPRPTTTASPRSPRRTSYLSAVDSASTADLDSILTDGFTRNLAASPDLHKPHRLHVYATKHNTHITFVQPPKPASQTLTSSANSNSAADQKKMVDVLLSVSTGNIGFRKAGRGSYDAAYQLGAWTLNQIHEKGMLSGVKNLQVVLRGFGAGRDAVTKVILGSEGRNIRGKIGSVVDATRLKLGGPRSKKPRRLG